jgi:hypothetical protein
MRRSIAGLLAVVLGLACAKSSGTKAGVGEPPPLDRSTPDRLVESVWKLETWLLLEEAHAAKERKNPVAAAFTVEVQAEFQKNLDEVVKRGRFRDNNRVVKAQVESETRATVLADEFLRPAWNDDAPPESEEITYLLAKSPEGWSVRDKTHVCGVCRGTKMVSDSDERIKNIGVAGRV